jgi:benzylsuccinate CoA-transferase BbsF subunit
VLLALEDRRRTGEGQWIDLAQYELAAISGISPLLQYQVTGEKWGRHGNRHPWFAPHNIYASKGDGSELGDSDSWLAIAIEDHSEWPKLVQALDGALENRPAWATFEVRKSDEDEIDSQIAAWAAERTNLEAAEYLQAAGVRAAPVNRYDQALRNPQPWHRGYLVRAEHQECGVRIVPGVWQRFERTPGRVRWGAPNFGAQNQYVLRGLLGMSDKQVARAFAEGETADEPTGLARPAAAGIPIDRSIELGVARGVAPGYRDWNRAGEFVHLADDPTVGWGPIPESGS